jgi:enamine deaminase RidA (YjgF/YER057c/UK114 family)
MDVQTTNQSQLLIEVVSHLVQLLGWPCLVACAWKMRGWLTEAQDTFAAKLDKMTDNHLNHIQEAMQVNAEAMKDVAFELRELRNDIRLAPFKRD